MNAKDRAKALQGKAVRARHKIEQSPCAEDANGNAPPDVPRGTRGTVDGWDELMTDALDGWLWVEFGKPWGVVLCALEDVEEV